MLSKIEIQEIIELDRINMQPVLDKFSIKFDCKMREEGIKKELNTGAKFLILRKEGKIIAYLEYLFENEEVCKIPSIQTYPENQDGFTLVRLLVIAYTELKKNCPKWISSSVHKSNQSSIKLHEKLGFVNVDETNERIEFKINGEQLLNNIQRYYRRNKNY